MAILTDADFAPSQPQALTDADFAPSPKPASKPVLTDADFAAPDIEQTRATAKAEAQRIENQDNSVSGHAKKAVAGLAKGVYNLATLPLQVGEAAERWRDTMYSGKAPTQEPFFQSIYPEAPMQSFAPGYEQSVAGQIGQVAPAVAATVLSGGTAAPAVGGAIFGLQGAQGAMEQNVQNPQAPILNQVGNVALKGGTGAAMGAFMPAVSGRLGAATAGMGIVPRSAIIAGGGMAEQAIVGSGQIAADNAISNLVVPRNPDGSLGVAPWDTGQQLEQLPVNLAMGLGTAPLGIMHANATARARQYSPNAAPVTPGEIAPQQRQAMAYLGDISGQKIQPYREGQAVPVARPPMQQTQTPYTGTIEPASVRRNTAPQGVTREQNPNAVGVNVAAGDRVVVAAAGHEALGHRGSPEMKARFRQEHPELQAAGEATARQRDPNLSPEQVADEGTAYALEQILYDTNLQGELAQRAPGLLRRMAKLVKASNGQKQLVKDQMAFLDLIEPTAQRMEQINRNRAQAQPEPQQQQPAPVRAEQPKVADLPQRQPQPEPVAQPADAQEALQNFQQGSEPFQQIMEDRDASRLAQERQQQRQQREAASIPFIEGAAANAKNVPEGGLKPEDVLPNHAEVAVQVARENPALSPAEAALVAGERVKSQPTGKPSLQVQPKSSNLETTQKEPNVQANDVQARNDAAPADAQGNDVRQVQGQEKAQGQTRGEGDVLPDAEPGQVKPEPTARIVHIGPRESEASIRQNGLKYTGSIDSTARIWSNPDEAQYHSDDPRFAGGSAYVFDVPQSELRNHTNPYSSKEVLDPKYLVEVRHQPSPATIPPVQEKPGTAKTPEAQTPERTGKEQLVTRDEWNRQIELGRQKMRSARTPEEHSRYATELGTWMRDHTYDGPAPAAVKGKGKKLSPLGKLIDAHENNVEATSDDFVNDIRAHLDEHPNERLQKAVDAYDDAQREHQRLGMRMDLPGEAADEVMRVAKEEAKQSFDRPAPTAGGRNAEPVATKRPQEPPNAEPPAQAVEPGGGGRKVAASSGAGRAGDQQQQPTAPKPQRATNIPQDWVGRTLYDFGAGPKLKGSEAATGASGRKTQRFSPEFMGELEKFDRDQKSLLDAVKAKTTDVWEVQGGRGGYVLAAKIAVKEATAELQAKGIDVAAEARQIKEQRAAKRVVYRQNKELRAKRLGGIQDELIREFVMTSGRYEPGKANTPDKMGGADPKNQGNITEAVAWAKGQPQDSRGYILGYLLEKAKADPKGTAYEWVQPSKLLDGSEVKIGNETLTVEHDPDTGEVWLHDGINVKAPDSLEIPAKEVREGQLPDVDQGDPFADLAPEPPSAIKKDLFGKPFIDSSGIGEQGALFTEGAKISRPVDPDVAKSRAKWDEKATGSMFSRPAPLTPEERAMVDAEVAKPIEPDKLAKGFLARMDQHLRKLGYDSRGAEDVLKKMKDWAVKNGKINHEDWQAAYTVAMQQQVQKSAAAESKATYANVDWKRMRALGTTDNIKEAGYIAPNGSLIDLSGKREGGDPGTRALDHREVGGTVGMQEAMAAGYIRTLPESGGIDLSIAPTPAQERQIARIAMQRNGEVILELQDGQGPLNRSGDYYEKPTRSTELEYPAGTKATKIIGDIRRFYAGEDIESGTRYSRPAPPTPEEQALARDDEALKNLSRKAPEWYKGIAAQNVQREKDVAVGRAQERNRQATAEHGRNDVPMSDAIRTGMERESRGVRSGQEQGVAAANKVAEQTMNREVPDVDAVKGLRTLSQSLRRWKSMSVEEVTDLQKSLIQTIKNNLPENDDRAKLLTAISNTTDIKGYARAIAQVRDLFTNRFVKDAADYADDMVAGGLDKSNEPRIYLGRKAPEVDTAGMKPDELHQHMLKQAVDKATAKTLRKEIDPKEFTDEQRKELRYELAKIKQGRRMLLESTDHDTRLQLAEDLRKAVNAVKMKAAGFAAENSAEIGGKVVRIKEAAEEGVKTISDAKAPWATHSWVKSLVRTMKNPRTSIATMFGEKSKVHEVLIDGAEEARTNKHRYDNLTYNEQVKAIAKAGLKPHTKELNDWRTKKIAVDLPDAGKWELSKLQAATLWGIYTDPEIQPRFEKGELFRTGDDRTETNSKRITRRDVEALVEQGIIGPGEKAYIEHMKDFTYRMAPAVMDASVRLRGSSPDYHKGYMPTHRKDIVRESVPNAWKDFTKSMENQGFLEKRVFSDTDPYVLYDAIEAFDRYHNGAGDLMFRAEQIRAAHVLSQNKNFRRALEQKFGTSTVKALDGYIENLAGVIQRPRNIPEKIIAKLTQNYARAAVAMNSSVMALNMTAGPVSTLPHFEMGDWQYGVKHMFDPGVRERMMEHPDIWARYHGEMYSHISMLHGEHVPSVAVMDTTEAFKSGHFGQAIQQIPAMKYADATPMAQIYASAEHWAQRTMPNATPAERAKAIEKKVRVTMLDTQNGSSATEISEAGRIFRQNPLLAPALMFTSDTNKKANMILRAAVTRQNRGKVALAVGLSALIYGATTPLKDKSYASIGRLITGNPKPDDEDEKLAKRYLMRTVRGAAGIAYADWAVDVANRAVSGKNYSNLSNSPGGTAFEFGDDLVSLVAKATKAYNEEDPEERVKKWQQARNAALRVVNSGSMVAGNPLIPEMRSISGAYKASNYTEADAYKSDMGDLDSRQDALNKAREYRIRAARLQTDDPDKAEEYRQEAANLLRDTKPLTGAERSMLTRYQAIGRRIAAIKKAMKEGRISAKVGQAQIDRMEKLRTGQH